MKLFRPPVPNDKMSAVHKAMALPEIVGHIVNEIRKDYTRGRTCLLQLLTVNKLWSHEALRVIWGSRCPEAALLSVPIERRQYYANLISDITIDHVVGEVLVSNSEERSEQRQASAKYGVTYPRLTCVGLGDRESCISKEELEQYFVCGLTILWLYSSSIRKDLLDLALNVCPSLRHVHIYAYSRSGAGHQLDNKDDLLRFISNCAATDLVIRASFVERVQVLTAAAEHGKYEKLSIEYISDEEIRTVKERHGQPFEHLTSFGCLNTKLQQESLISMTPNLKSLYLSSLPDLIPTIEQLAEYHGLLEEVRLTALHGILDKNMLAKLSKRQKRLKYLSITVTVKNDTQLFDDGCLHALIDNLPSLQHLRLCVNHCLTKKSVVSIGRACPSLCILDLKPGFGLQGVDALRLSDEDLAVLSETLFTNLRWIAPEEIMKALSAKVAARHFPTIRLIRLILKRF